MSVNAENGTVVALLQAQVNLLGRVAIPEDKLIDTICKGRSDAKQLQAYNLCDGTRTQAEVGKAAKLDSGNFSRTVSRWLKSGILFKLPDGKEERLQHLYPVSADHARKS